MTVKRVRSPNYPAISLSEAVPRIKSIFEREHTHPADSNTLAQALGYSGTNGASDAVLSALKKYGLLEDAGNREYKLSPNAIDIVLHQPGEPERVKAISEAAFAPPLFAELHDDLGINPPPSENNLRVRLLKRNFNPRSVGEAVRAYLDTIEFLSEEAPGFAAGSTGDVKPVSSAAEQPTNEPPLQSPKPPASNPARQEQNAPPPAPVHAVAPPQLPAVGDSVLVFRISRDSEARVTFSGQVTQEAIGKLLLLLEASKDTFPTQEELAQKARPAIWRNKDHDRPVSVIGDLGAGPDGRPYMRIAGSETGVPQDELEFID